MRWCAAVVGAGLVAVVVLLVRAEWDGGVTWQVALLSVLLIGAGVDLLSAAWTGRRRGIAGAVLMLGGM